jgi:transposase InsO family protein
MPWRKADALSERTKFILEWERRCALELVPPNVSELCRMYGISRQTGHLWISRYVQGGCDLRTLDDRSRRPHSNPRAVTPQIEDFIVAARKAHPRWGPVLLRAWLVQRFPRYTFPSASCIGAILKRRGMTASKRRKRRRGMVVVMPPFPSCDHSNDVWGMDFKGWFRMGDGEICYPFTLLDAFSRLLLRCEGLLVPDGDAVRSILDSAFREFGLPKRIRSDGGPPFFNPQSPATLSYVSVWLLRLGIVVECIAPAKPQQNGRLERLHRTLKDEVVRAESILPQRRELDTFRRTYNFERPHTALGMQPPWSVYRRSPRKYPRPLLTSVGLQDHQERVDRKGFIRWRGQRVFIGEAFIGEAISMFPTENTTWEVSFGHVLLGHLDEQAPTLFRRTKRGKGSMSLSYENNEWQLIDQKKVSGMSMD